MPNPNPKKEYLQPNYTQAWKKNDDPLTEKVCIRVSIDCKKKLDEMDGTLRITLLRQAIYKIADES